jgi:outer membrane phospholipase A
MIEFINLSTYIYKRLGHMKQKKHQKNMLKFLIVAATSMYDELYSSRGKIAFAYYFKKVLQNSDNLKEEITPYNNKSWKSEFVLSIQKKLKKTSLFF